MNDINKYCDDNVGGLYFFRYIPSDDVESIIESIDNKVTEPVTLKEGKRWFEFYATQGTMEFNEDQQPSPQGDYYKAVLSGNTPKDRAEVENIFNLMKNSTFILDYTDNNGTRKLVGTTTEPLRFKSKLSTGDNLQKKNGHSFEFFGDILNKSPEYFI